MLFKQILKIFKKEALFLVNTLELSAVFSCCYAVLFPSYLAFYSTELLRNYLAFSSTELLRNYLAFSSTELCSFPLYRTSTELSSFLEFFFQNFKHSAKFYTPKTEFCLVPAGALEFFFQNFKHSAKFFTPQNQIF